MADIFKGKMRMDQTMDFSEIVDADYRILGLHQQEIQDTNGDIIILKFYRNYDSENDIFSGIAVNEDRVYTRDTSTGLLKKRETSHTWYDIEGNIIATKTQVQKFYSSKKGFQSNKRARQNLIDKASMYLFSALATNNAGDMVLTEIEIDDFESLTDSASSKYLKSNTDPLINIITNSTDNTKPEFRGYITAGIQQTLLTILNISYTN